jgi:PhzF family phenazine biosynthesis protein
MTIKLYQVDAFTDRLFSGNPAAVCPLREWLPDDLMQKIAMENNLAETAFYVPKQEGYQIRWFTPSIEVALCGHATLAAAHVLFEHEKHQGDTVVFGSQSGELGVSKRGDWLTLNFPADNLTPVPLSVELTAGFSVGPVEAFKGRSDYLLVYETEEQIRTLEPDFLKISQLPVRGVIVTARGRQTDFVSRFFAPQSGISEDPVTGSAHTSLTPYWSAVLQRTELSALQLSARTGYLRCRLSGSRVEISGQARTFMIGEIILCDSVKFGSND